MPEGDCHISPDQDTTWFYDEGELTELDTDESDQEEPTPPPPPRQSKHDAETSSTSKRTKATRASTQSATEKSRVRRGLKNTIPLKPPRTTNYSASSLFDWIQDDLVDLDPEYQRGVVWNETKQEALIGSLFCNYYVPPIVFTVKRKNDGTEIRVCIDGKQRLTSIHRFMLGEIANKDVITNRKAFFINPPGSKKKLITDAMRGVFKNKQITCVEYEDLTEEQEREIFQRVQLGVSLSPADRLPAINGPLADLVRELRRRIENTQGFKFYLDWGAARGKDFQALAQIVYLISYGHQKKCTEPSAVRLENYLNKQPPQGGPSLKELEDAAINVVAIYCRIARHRELGNPVRKNLTPLEFVMMCYLIYVHHKKLSDTQLSDAMRLLRDEFSIVSPDKKTNTTNFNVLLSFVRKEVPKLTPELKRGPKNERSAFEALTRHMTEVSQHLDFSKQSDKESVSSIGIPDKPKAKRKRDESDGEDSYIVPSKKKVTKQKVEVKQTPPPDIIMAKATKTETGSRPSKAGLPPNSRSGTAKTVVKPSSARNKSAAGGDKKKAHEPQVVSNPTVRPPPSSKTPSTNPAATNSASTSSGASSSTNSKKPSVSLPSTSAAPSLPRAPLPSRARAAYSPSTSSVTPIASSSASAGTAGAPPTNTPQEVSSISRQASPTDAPPLRGSGPASTGGQSGRDRLAPLRNAKAFAENQTAGVSGSSRGVAVSDAGPTQGLGEGSMASVGANTGSGKRSQLPKFNKQHMPVPVESGEATWTEDIGQLLNLVKGGAGAVAGGVPLQRDPPRGPRAMAFGGTAATNAAQPQVQTGLAEAGMATFRNGALATPTASPNIPYTTRWGPPVVPVAEQPTKDPRIAARQAAAAAAASEAASEQQRQQHEYQQRRLQQRHTQAPTPPPSASPHSMQY